MKMLIESQYLPPVEVFILMLKHTGLIIEGCENYQKQSYRNRCRILGANNIQDLTVPVKNNTGKMQVRDVMIDYDQNWMPVHWRSIESGYGKAPFFEFYEEYFKAIYFKKPKFLFDLNMELLLLCLGLLRLDINAEVSRSFQVTGAEENGINDLRSNIHPKKSVRRYKIEFVNYRQVFGKEFAENLSIIDLLFCEGPSSLEILKKSLVK